MDLRYVEVDWDISPEDEAEGLVPPKRVTAPANLTGDELTEHLTNAWGFLVNAVYER